MTVFEWVMAGLFGVLGVRSLVYWVRRPLASQSVRDQALFAAWVTGRAGLWFAVGGIFAISASIGETGARFTHEFQRYRWYIFVPLSLAILHFVAGLALGRSKSE